MGNWGDWTKLGIGWGDAGRGALGIIAYAAAWVFIAWIVWAPK